MTPARSPIGPTGGAERPRSSAPGEDGDTGRIPDADWIAAGFRWSTFAEGDETQPFAAWSGDDIDERWL